MIVVVDNYDSFTYNLVRYIKLACSLQLKVIKNDELQLNEIIRLKPSYLVLSPGPGHPIDSGCTIDVINYFHNKVPILGVCLGHQAIGYYFKAHISRTKNILHGKTSSIQHNNDPIFNSVNQNFKAARYHSLIIKKNTLPDCLSIIASSDGEIMAIKHIELPIYGLQFHPEAFLTYDGQQIINNFFEISH